MVPTCWLATPRVCSSGLPLGLPHPSPPSRLRATPQSPSLARNCKCACVLRHQHPPSAQRHSFGKCLKGPQRIHGFQESVRLLLLLETKGQDLPKLPALGFPGPAVGTAGQGGHTGPTHIHPGLSGPPQWPQVQGWEKRPACRAWGFPQTETLQPEQILPESAEAPARPGPQRSCLHGCVGTCCSWR